jgi:hypothetical protein
MNHAGAPRKNVSRQDPVQRKDNVKRNISMETCMSTSSPTVHEALGDLEVHAKSHLGSIYTHNA